MQTIAAIAMKVVAGAKAAGSAVVSAGKAVFVPGGGSAPAFVAAGKGAKVLSAVRVGATAVAALSAYQQSRLQADALEREAFDQEMASNQGFIQAQEENNAILREYNRTVMQQLAVAAAGGIDISSGSVIEARQQAQDDVDRQLTITRNGASMNAALRRARAAGLRGSAAMTREGAALAAVAKVGQGYLDSRKVG